MYSWNSSGVKEVVRTGPGSYPAPFRGLKTGPGSLDDLYGSNSGGCPIIATNPSTGK